jgi:hypothetical protein
VKNKIASSTDVGIWVLGLVYNLQIRLSLSRISFEEQTNITAEISMEMAGYFMFLLLHLSARRTLRSWCECSDF